MTGGPIDADAAWDRLLLVRDAAGAATAGLQLGPTGAWEWVELASSEAAQLASLYTPLALAGPQCAFAQLGQSLDGFIATRTGDAVFVTGEEDRRHLHRLRALADAVIVGAATAIADDPQLTVRAAPGNNPVRVVLDPRGRVPADRRLFNDDSAATLWITAGDVRPAAPHVEVVRLSPPTADGFAPQHILDALGERGLGRVLVEGGGATVSRFFCDGALSRIYLTVAGVLIGNGMPGLRFPGTDVMRDALRPSLRTYAMGDDVLFDLDLAADLQ